MERIRVKGYQVLYPQMCKKAFEISEELYNMALIKIRLEELQERGAFLHKIGKPTRKGTKMTFNTVNNTVEYERELQKIVDDGEKLGLKFEKINAEAMGGIK